MNRARELASLPERAAERFGAVTVDLDRPLDSWPRLGRSLDYTLFADLVEDGASWLWAAGVRRGDHVAIVKENNPDILVLLYSCLRIGAVPALVSSRLGAASTSVMLARLSPRAIVSDAATIGSGTLDGRPSGAPMVAVDGALPGCLSPADLSGGAAPPPAFRRGDEPALILHTSGTTGVPKLVQHTAASIARGALVGRWHRSLRYGALRSADTVAACLSWSHVRAVFGFGFAMSKGARLVAISDPDPAVAAEMLRGCRPSVLETHPNVFQRWRRLATADGSPLESVRLYVSTADAIHPPTVRTLLDASRRRRAAFVQVYGMSELGPVAVRVFTKRRARRRTDARVAGMTIPLHSRVRVVDPGSGRRVRPGRPGIIQAKTSSRFLTYLGQEDQARKARDRRWFTTADRGVRGWDGRLRLLDRQVDHIRGIDSALAIEERLLDRVPELTEVVVIDLGDERPTPVICTDGDRPLRESEWKAAVGDLPHLASPHRICYRDLPMTPTWKVRRFMLRELLIDEELVGRSVQATGEALEG